MRITQGLLVSRTRDQLATRLDQFATSQRRLASGKRFERPSEDIAGVDRAMRSRAALANRLQESRNADDGQQWINLADSKLQGATSLLQRARELAITAAAPGDQTSRDAIAEEITSIRDQLVGLANDKSQGRGLFSGTLPTDAVTLVGGVWTYTGNPEMINRRISSESTVQINVTGDDVFGFNGATDTFSALDQLTAAIQAGDTAAIDVGITDMDVAIDNVLEGLGKLGSAGSRIEEARIDQQRDIGTLERMVSEIEDVDLAESVMEVQLQEVAYQAALQASSRALTPSLLDFIR